MRFRIIGDVHGDRRYLDLIKGCDYSLQVGDMSYDYSILDTVDPEKHKFIPGNHEDYDKVFDQPHCLGNFGVYENPVCSVFFIRGAWSIDKKYRTFKVDWFPNEEMSQEEWGRCIDLYAQVKPDILISHDCPFSILSRLSNPNIAKSFGFNSGNIRTITGAGLDECISIHKPKNHFFGHHHKWFDEVIDGVHYYCIPTLKYIDLELGSEAGL